ncbi:dynactin 5, partial [Lecanoromycetidae sp. Uapishka_2]
MPPKTPTTKPKGDYIETDTGNKVARKAQLYGTQHIILGGRTTVQPEVCIRGDLVRAQPPKDPKAAPQHNTSVTIGRYTLISTGSILRPPSRLHKGAMTYYPLKIGDHT